MKPKAPKKRLNFSKPAIVRTLILLVLSLCAYQATGWIPAERRYVRQGFVAAATVLLILCFVSLWKLFNREIRMELYRRISEAVFNAGERFRALKRRIRAKLGLPERSDLRGRDERHIVFYTADSSRRARRAVKKLRYSDLGDNRQRIRFLWARYVLSFTKKGQHPSISQTPAEIGEALGSGEDAAPLFALYYTARYADDSAQIDDRAVNEQAEFVGTRGRL